MNNKVFFLSPVIFVALILCGISNAQSVAGNSSFIAGEIAKPYLYAQTGKNVVFCYASEKAQFDEFVAAWRPIMERFNLTPGETEYKNNLGFLYYSSPDGSVIRDFIADKLNYDALKPGDIRRLQRELVDSLNDNGLKPIASFIIRLDSFRPTFNIYYLTKPNDNPDKEKRMRILKYGEDIDFDLLRNVEGLNIIREDNSFTMLYIGGLLGMKSKLASSEESMDKTIEDYKKFLLEHEKDFIDAKIHILEKPITVGELNLKYLANIYFWQ